MPVKRWFHCSGNNMAFGFAINQHFVVVDCGDKGFKELYGKCVKDPQIRQWFTENYLTVTEVKPNEIDLQQVQTA